MSGTVVLEERQPTLPASAMVRVRLEDITRADAPARVVAEQVIRASREEALGFALHGRPLDPTHSYSVRAHVDLSGDGNVSPGDFVSVESHPVSAEPTPPTVTVTVRRIPGGD